MNRTYLVTYKTGATQVVYGKVVFFSSINTEVPRPTNAIYLNADEVVSVVAQDTEPQQV